MVAVFATMMLALLAAYWGRRWLALAALAACLAFFVGEFLWEIYSPTDGFRLPLLHCIIDGCRLA